MMLQPVNPERMSLSFVGYAPDSCGQPRDDDICEGAVAKQTSSSWRACAQ